MYIHTIIIIEYPDGTKAKDVPRFYTDAEGDTKSVRTHT